MMNNFGHEGGFDLLLDLLENVQADNKVVDIASICTISAMIANPIKLWHKDWIAEYGERFAQAVQN